MADPAALGLGAFALPVIVLSVSHARILPAAASVVSTLALIYSGIAQIPATVIKATWKPSVLPSWAKSWRRAA